MRASRWVTIVVAATAMIGLITAGGPAAVAQDATPQAEQGQIPRPAHIHVNDCANIGDVVAPLNDLTAPTGQRVGVRRAFEAESSFTTVPMTLDQILASDHSLNVHMSADQMNVYIACGDLGGVLTPDGALVIGLAEQNNSGYTGIAYLSPGSDGASTDVSVFIAPVVGGGRGGDNQNQAANTRKRPRLPERLKLRPRPRHRLRRQKPRPQSAVKRPWVRQRRGLATHRWWLADRSLSRWRSSQSRCRRACQQAG